MSARSNRLADTAADGLGGDWIDRGHPISFRLNGMTIEGFAGDTVLSATVAAGISGAGTRGGLPLALTPRFAPPVRPARAVEDEQALLPMQRTPIIEGAEYVTPGFRASSRLVRTAASLFGKRPDTLGERFERDFRLHEPWIDQAPEASVAVDLLVVGAGAAGLAAAEAAARTGLQVAVVERAQSAGGAFGLFHKANATGGNPDRLFDDLRGRDNVTFFFRTEVLRLAEGQAVAHQVRLDGTTVEARLVAFTAPRIVLATGALERLPVFPGNRLPGLTGALSAFFLARRFGVWPGSNAMIATSANAGYRLATLASEAGVRVARIIDPRLAPASRLVDFAKAASLPMAPGITPVRAEHSPKTGRIAVQTRIVNHGTPTGDTLLDVDRLVIAGGWQPDLSLWHGTGGGARWDDDRQQLLPEGDVDGVAMAGSAAGWRDHTAVLESARAAVARLLGRRADEISEPYTDPHFETPDAAFPPVQTPDAVQHAYLDGGASLTMLGADEAVSGLEAAPRAISIGDLTAHVLLGQIDGESIHELASERCIPPRRLVDVATARPAEQAPRFAGGSGVPHYLAGRFGDAQKRVAIASADGRAFETGSLIFANSDLAEPTDAVGVVTEDGGQGKTQAALVAIRFAEKGVRLVVRDGASLSYSVIESDEV